MNWLDKLRGKGNLPGREPDKAPDPPQKQSDGTVLRDGAARAPTIAKPVMRFQPNHEVTADLQIKNLLGSGTMGEVYLARQRQWDVDVALKIPNEEILADPENRHRIIREAETWIDLGLHPNIAYCYYTQPVGELLLLVIEYADGGNLRKWIADGRCADLKTGLDLAIQFCHGLEHAHKKLVHRDIKPENILLTQDGTLKITDFGIVRKALAGPEVLQSSGAVRQAAAAMTVVGIGTPDYMAPEQWEDQSRIDSGVDLFAFGVCLYEMLCGARPYRITAGSRQEAPDPGRLRGGKGLPERLCRLMKRCVDWDRERRPAGAQEVRAELCVVYGEEFGHVCPHGELPELVTQANDCNNRALSYLALGRVEDAEKAWQTALEADPQHPESIYNYGLHRWRGAKATDQELLTKMRVVAESDPSAWLPRYLTAQVHLERGDVEGSREELAKIQKDGENKAEVVAARRAFEDLSVPTELVRVFEGAYGPGRLSADGRFVLSGGVGNTIKLWDAESGCCLRTFEGHTRFVSSLCLSRCGRYALSGGADKTLKLWELESGRCLQSIEGHTGTVVSCLSADGRLALSGSESGPLRLWDLATGGCLRTFAGQAERVVSVCLSTDGRFAMSAGRQLMLWDVRTGECLRTFEGHTDLLESVCLSVDGRFALSGSNDKTLKLWDVGSGQCLQTFEGHTNFVIDVCLSANGQFALSGGADGMKLWDVARGMCLRTFEGDTEAWVGLSADGGRALSLGASDTARLWRIGTFQHRASFRLSRATASTESIAAGARHAAALVEARIGAATGDVVRVCRCLRRARQESAYRRREAAALEWARLYGRLRSRGLTDCWQQWNIPSAYDARICLSADGRSILAGGWDYAVRQPLLKLWDVETSVCVRPFEGQHTDGILSVSLGVDGRFALSGSRDKTARLWDVASGRCLRTFEGHTRDVDSACLSTDGRFALSGSHDNTLKLWAVASGRCLRTFEGHTSFVKSACLSPEGRFALSASWDNTLKLWDVASGGCMRTFEGHTSYVDSACLSADGRLALSGGYDNTVRLWDVASGRNLRTFQGHADHVASVCFSPEGRYALSGSLDKTLKVWDLDGGSCLRTLDHLEGVKSVTVSPDRRHAISVWGVENITAWFLDWDLEENEPADWDEGALPCLDIFLRAHQPYVGVLPRDRQPTNEEVTRALTRKGRPEWSEDDFKSLLYTLGCAGYGWLRPEGVRRELERMTREWSEPT